MPDYELLRLIGRGSYGDVWLARGVTGVFRAVKLVWRERFADLRPYEREFEGITRFTAVSLREPSQLALLHVGRDDAASYFYYVMELADDATRGRDIVPGEYVPLTLREVRERRGRLPAGEIVALGVALARALASLHATGLVHRDIKPSNIVFVGGVPKLADVGLVAEASAGLTFVGTEGFVPPEGPGAPAADVFSLGKVLYELATGLDRQEYPRLPADFGTWPDSKEFLELNEVLIRACEPNATARFPDAAALLEELLLLQAGKSVRRLRNAEKRTAQALRIAAVLALIASVAGVGAWVERQRANQELTLREKAEAERDDLARREVYSAALAQAQRALEQDEYGRARQFLQSVVPKPGKPDLRSFEWHALWNDAQGDPAIVLRASGSPGTRVRYSSAAHMIALHTEEREIILWDADTKKELRRIKDVRVLGGFSEDGHWIFGTMLDAGKARLHRWRAEDGSLDGQTSFGVSRPLGSIGKDQWLGLSQAASGQIIYLRCCDFATGKEVWSHEVPFTGAQNGDDLYNSNAVAVSPDGDMCALVLYHRDAIGVRWRILLLSLPDMGIVWNETTTHRPTAATFGPRGETLDIIWDDTGEVNCYDIHGQKWRWHTQMPMNRLVALAHDNDRLLAVSARAGSIFLVDLNSGRIVGVRRGHESEVQDAVFLPERRQLLSTGSSGDVRLWSLTEDSTQREFSGFWAPTGGGREVCVSSDGRNIAATAPLNQNIELTTAYTRVIQSDPPTKTADLSDTIAPISFFDENKRLWTVSKRGSLVAYTVTLPQEACATIDLPFKPICFAASGDSRHIVCLDPKAALVFVDTQSNKVSDTISSGHIYPYWVAVTTDGKRAATSGQDLMVRLWDVPSNRMLSSWKFPDRIVNGAFAPDGRSLALLHLNGILEVRDTVGTVAPVRVVTSSGILHAIAFHPKEPRLFLGGQNGTVHVLDTNRWVEVAQFHAAPSGSQPNTVERAAVSADASLLVGYTESGTLRLWRGSVPSR